MCTELAFIFAGIAWLTGARSRVSLRLACLMFSLSAPKEAITLFRALLALRHPAR
jgi:hypothetical protein